MLDIVLIAVVAVAVFTDLKANKIYNSLCLFALISGFVLNWINGEFSSALLSLAAALAAGLIFIPFYIKGGMAAGDVKLMVGCAAIIGWPYGILAAGLSLIAGTVLGIVYYCIRGGGKEFYSRYSSAFRNLLGTGKAYLPIPAPDSVASSRFPYALAIASGCLLTQFVFLQ